MSILRLNAYGNPANEKAVLAFMELLMKRKRFPKQRRYVRGSRKLVDRNSNLKPV